MNIIWEDKETNIRHGEALMRRASRAGAGLIIFPEMSFTGFSMNVAKIGEDVVQCSDGFEMTETTRRMQNLSSIYHIGAVFGYVRKATGREAGKGFNSLMAVDNGHVLASYDKLHPFSYGAEGGFYLGGAHLADGVMQGIPFGFFICYDLRFPEIFQISSQRSHAFIVIANWPEERMEHWKVLLRARAIENQCYMLGVNRVGKGGSLNYAPSSMAFGPCGEQLEARELFLAETEGENESNAGRVPELLLVEINDGTVEECRKEFPLKLDRRESLYRNLWEESN